MTGTSALTSMWAWHNPVDPALDARGRSYAPAEPDALAAFCLDRGLDRVFLGAPWAADEGPVGTWFGAACLALQQAGVAVSVLGGDPPWIDQPSLAVTWATTALASAHVAGAAPDAVQLDVEPWTTTAWEQDRTGVTLRWLGVLETVRASLPSGVGLGVDAPWWLAYQPDPTGTGATLLDAVLARCDRVGVVAFIDHADGPDGIIALAGPAVVAASMAGRPFTVGVETDTAEVAGGAQYTFVDEGPAVLEQETALVADAFGGLTGYQGVTVEHHRAWRALLGLDA
ncbi:hypothetical protein ACTHAM_000783 [Cellulomonas soli]|uniref:hypothetical protein n=1 Tax=Cellulomonas soli TaxID=931535 RepID=UPI003F842F5D